MIWLLSRLQPRILPSPNRFVFRQLHHEIFAVGLYYTYKPSSNSTAGDDGSSASASINSCFLPSIFSLLCPKHEDYCSKFKELVFYIIECFLPLLDGHGIKDHIISPSWTLIFPWTRQGNIGCPGRWICLEDTRETKGKEGKQTTKSIPCQKPTRI